jgi:hypothetical protein
MRDTYIESLTKLLSQSIDDSATLDIWKSQAINILTRIYGENSKQEEQIKSINYKTYPAITSFNRQSGGYKRAGGGNNIDECIKIGQGLIRNFIDELNQFGLPEPKSKANNDKISININQTQNVKVDFNILLKDIKNELTGKQFGELENILKENDEPETKKNKIVDKLKSFGSDVATNIIANILTNPQLWGL